MTGRKSPEGRSRKFTSKVVIKIGVSLLLGLAVYALSLMISEKARGATLLGIGVSIFVGGVALVTQFLVDVERDLESLRSGVTNDIAQGNSAARLIREIEASHVDTATMEQLIHDVAGVSRQTPTIMAQLVRSEIHRVADFVRDISQRSVATYTGEDRDWLLGLTKASVATIDATSMATVDGGATGGVDGGLWTTDLGQRYLDAQRAAIQRGVAVRRIFIRSRFTSTDEDLFRRTCEYQRRMNVQVRVLDWDDIPGAADAALLDFIIFDRDLCYETISSPRPRGDHPPTIASTHLTARREQVEERRLRFEELWEAASDI